MRVVSLAAAAAAFLASGAALAAGAHDEQLDKQTFVANLHEDSQVEIQLAKQAEQKASSPQVKDFARTLVDDHTRMLQRVDQFAKQAKLSEHLDKSKLPQTDQLFDDSMKSFRTALSQMKGADYDQAFLDYSLAEHDHDIAGLTRAQQQFQGTPEGDLAASSLPVIRKHREKAYTLLNPNMQQRQARQPPAR